MHEPDFHELWEEPIEGGWRAHCWCGWTSELYAAKAEALDAAYEHERPQRRRWRHLPSWGYSNRAWNT